MTKICLLLLCVALMLLILQNFLHLLSLEEIIWFLEKLKSLLDEDNRWFIPPSIH